MRKVFACFVVAVVLSLAAASSWAGLVLDPPPEGSGTVTMYCRSDGTMCLESAMSHLDGQKAAFCMANSCSGGGTRPGYSTGPSSWWMTGASTWVARVVMLCRQQSPFDPAVMVDCGESPLSVSGIVMEVEKCKPGNVASSGYFDIGTNSAANPVLIGCKGGCGVRFDGVSPVGTSIEGGVKHWYAKGAYINNGTVCSAEESSAKGVSEGKSEMPAQSCGEGQGWAKMNGKVVCVDQTERDKQTEASKDKSTSKTEKTSVTNPDGSVTTTETTTEDDGKGNKTVKKTVTTTPAGGGAGTTETTTTKSGPGTTGSTSGGGSSGDDEGDGEKSECEKNPSGAGCGGEGAAIGTLYTPKDKTMSGVLGAARDSFLASPIGTSVGGFFIVSAGGSCPSWNGHIPFVEADITIDQFCSSFATNALAVFKVCILVVASFMAFRIAVE